MITLALLILGACATNNGNCEDVCTTRSDSSFYCSCDSGYSIDLTGIVGGCSTTCVNAEGWTHCLCQSGYHYVKPNTKNYPDFEGTCVAD